MRRFLAFEVQDDPEINRVYTFFSQIRTVRISGFKHVTLSFLGDMDYDQNLIDLHFRNKRAFSVRYHGIGGFPNARWARVIWIGVQLEYDIMQDFPYPKNDIYHLTVGRSNVGVDLTRLDLRRFDRVLSDQIVEKINLYETIVPGKSYRIISSYNLLK